MGFDLLNLPFSIERVRGFPVFCARTHFGAPGYRSVLGWTHLVRVRPFDGGLPSVFLDMEPRQYPVVFSYEPAFFDAPGPTHSETTKNWRVPMWRGAGASHRCSGCAGDMIWCKAASVRFR